MSRQAGRDTDTVRDATDLVQLIGEHVVLKQRGREFVGLCPFHEDHRPSFAVVTHKGNAFYKCHSCGAAGDAFNFMMAYHKMDFPTALRYLADKAGIKLTQRRDSAKPGASRDDREALLHANAAAVEFFRRVLVSPAGENARAMIARRGFTEQTMQDFALGAAPDQWEMLANWAGSGTAPSLSAMRHAGLVKARQEGSGCYDTFRNRLIFPICDDLGRPIAFGGRVLNSDDTPKYLNSPESPVFSKSRTLYGLHLAKRDIIASQQAIVTEGYTDVIACHQAGVRNVVATLGTALTREHAQLAARLCDTVVLIFDGDEAGVKAADRAVEVFFAGRVDVKICVLPDNLDPDDLLRQENGVQRFRDAIDRSVDALQFKIDRFQAQLASAGGLSARQRCLEDFGRDLGALGFASMPGVRQALVVNRIAELLNLAPADVQKLIPRQTQRRQTPTAHEATATATDSVVEPDEAVLQPASPLRRCAELDLLCLLIAQPELADTTVAIVVGSPRVIEVISEEDFVDAPARAVAEVLLPHLAAGQSCTMQQLLGELNDAALSTLVTDLFFNGEKRIEASLDPVELLVREAYAALRRMIERELYELTLADARRRHSDAASSVETFAELIRGCSRQGGNIAALPRVR